MMHRPSLVRLRLAVILSSLALAMHSLVSAGVAAGQGTPGVPFVVVASGATSGIREAAQYVIRDAAAWKDLWQRHAGASMRPIPAVDFERDMVIALFGGESRAPRALTVVRIVREGDALVVYYTQGETRPVTDTDGLAPTVPYQIVRVGRSPLPVRFSLVKTPQVYRSP
ncbi:MAG: hypothetical protein HY355_07345 [Armatimonadetes bacterium]|nr:hypothetical protein [Armatimonadota bacterium]